MLFLDKCGIIGWVLVADLEELGFGLTDVEFDDDTDGWIKWDKMLFVVG